MINNNYVYKGCFISHEGFLHYEKPGLFLLGANYESFTNKIRFEKEATVYQIKPNTSEWIINWCELPIEDKGFIYPDLKIAETNCSEKLVEILTLKGITTIKQLADTDSSGINRGVRFGKRLLYETYDLLEEYVFKFQKEG